MISSILIKGFRGIEQGQLVNLTQFNVFVGANNSGKSTAMEALYLASTANRPADLIVQTDKASIIQKVLLSGQDLLGNRTLDLIASKHSDAADSLALAWGNADKINVDIADPTAPETLQHFELEISQLRLSSDDASRIGLLALDLHSPADIGKPGNDISLVQQLIGESDAKNYPQRTVFCWHPDLTYYTKGSASWMIEGQPPVAQHTLFCDSSVLRSYVALPFYRHALNAVPGWTYRIGQHLAAIYELAAEPIISFLPRQGTKQTLQAWIGQKDRPALQIDAFGDGARAAFKLLAPLIVMAELATPEAPGLLLWEEPESFQNPKTLGRFLAEVVKIIRDKPIQVFIATHNLELVAYITQMLQEGYLKAEDTRLFQMNLFDGHLKSTWFTKDNLVSWLESGIDPRTWDDFVPPLQFHLKEELV